MSLPEIWSYAEPILFFVVFAFGIHNWRDLKSRIVETDEVDAVKANQLRASHTERNDTVSDAPVRLRVEETIIVGYDKHFARGDIIFKYFAAIVALLVVGTVASTWFSVLPSFLILSCTYALAGFLWIFNVPVTTLGRAALVSLGKSTITVHGRNYEDLNEGSFILPVTPKLRCCVTNRSVVTLKKAPIRGLLTVRCLEIADGKTASILIMFPLWWEFIIGKRTFDIHKSQIDEILQTKYHQPAHNILM